VLAIWQAMRRLSLGLALIGAASAALLLSDLGHRYPAAAATGAGAARTPAGPLPRTWQLDFVQLNHVLDVEETERGVLDGLRDAGLVEGRDYRVRTRNANGDMATVNGLIDAAITEGSDLLVTFSTPTLQAALQRAGRLPVVFTYVANALIAGAGTTDTDHRPTVTGVYLPANYDETFKVVRQVLPRARVVGTLFIPAEVNSVFLRDQMQAAAERAGYTVVSVPVNTSADVPDAALALVSKSIDLICQVPGNLTAAAFPSIAEAARRGRVPVIAFQTSQASGGALVTLARDHIDAGNHTGRLVARVMRGEDPATIPFQTLHKAKLIVNTNVAQSLGLTLPPDLLARANTVIGRGD
jgi:ABC-type uncharacterized transport system substrate-binding protein